MTVKDLLKIYQVSGSNERKHIYFNLYDYIFIGRNIICLYANNEEVYSKKIEEVLLND